MESKTTVNQEFAKLDYFDGINFVHWKDKMMFILTALKISYILDPNLLEIPTSTSKDNDQLRAERKKQDENELLCRGHILNNMLDCQYDLFKSIKSPKKI
jgi:hypothetical protein